MYRHAALYDMSTRVHRKTRALCRKLIRQLPGQTRLSVYTYIKLPCLPQLACRILLFRRGKKGGSDLARGARKLWLYDEKKASLTRLAGSTRELGQRVNAVIGVSQTDKIEYLALFDRHFNIALVSCWSFYV